MSANSFGTIFKMTSFGESHGTALGVIIEGCPAGVRVDLELLQKELGRRRPGQSSVTTSRNESDEPEILSGVFEGKTLGTPIAVMISNSDARSQDYSQIQNDPRIGHADDTWRQKFGHVDHRGGGRSSGRETAARVIAGAFARMLCQQIEPKMKVKSFASQISNFKLTDAEIESALLSDIDQYQTRFPSPTRESQVIHLLNSAKTEGQSYGGVVETHIISAPAGLGQPVFHKMKSDLAFAMLSIGATTGFELGSGFSSVTVAGTDFHESINAKQYGGIRGGISTGETINFRTAFKPTSSIKDVAKKGRHDPCIVTRAVPVVDAMVWLVLADHLLWSRLDRV